MKNIRSFLAKRISKISLAIIYSLFALIIFAHNSYAKPFVLINREIDRWEVIFLGISLVAVIIAPQKYRAKLIGILLGLIIVYLMLIVLHISTGLEFKFDS